MLSEHEFSRSDRLFDGVVEFVCARQVFQVFPISFDQVEFRTIRRQPESQKTMFKKTQRSTFMVGNIVHHQNDTTGWIASHTQVFDEFQERLAVLPIGDFPRDRIGVP